MHFKITKLKFNYLLFLFLFISNSVIAQTIYSQNNYPLTGFRPPLDIVPATLAGSFGELRSNHFHSGLDFRTNQRTGYPVYATADGYVSRVRVQNSGFGLALYINHNNGYTTVYAHLSRFNAKIAQIAKGYQYKNSSYEIDEFPNSTLIPVKRGDIIAYSGNTGSSGGPHLHFEIRDSKTEATLNPQLLGVDINDNIPPIIHAIYVYRLNEKPFNEFTPKQYFQVTGGNGKYNLNQVNTINVAGEIGFGIVVNDKHNGASGNNGAYAITLEVDGKTVFTSALERFTFNNSKAINSHIDYPTFIKTKQSIQKSFIDPGNPLKIYYNIVNNGRLKFDDDKPHDVAYTITDAKGNKSSLKFKVISNAGATIKPIGKNEGIPFSYTLQNDFNNDEVKVSLPKGTLYDNIDFTYKKQALQRAAGNTDMHYIHNNLTPLHVGFDLQIKADSVVFIKKDKALIVNSSGISQGGVFDNGWIKASPKNFGAFYVALDTIAPKITPINIFANKDMSAQQKMTFKISDNLSGIKSFNCYIDGKWVLAEFDAKTATLWHTFDERTTKGKHTLTLTVIDMKENSNTYKIDFLR